MRLHRHSFIALLLVIAASLTAFGANEDVIVSGSGDGSSVNGVYRVCGTSGGKPFYNRLQDACDVNTRSIHANGVEWELGTMVYRTFGGLDAALPIGAPWIAQNGDAFLTGSAPAPTVSVGMPARQRTSLGFFALMDDGNFPTSFLLVSFQRHRREWRCTIDGA